MNLRDSLGVSPQAALVAAAAGIVAAVVTAAGVFLRRSHARSKTPLGLDESRG